MDKDLKWITFFKPTLCFQGYVDFSMAVFNGSGFFKGFSDNQYWFFHGFYMLNSFCNKYHRRLNGNPDYFLPFIAMILRSVDDICRAST